MSENQIWIILKYLTPIIMSVIFLCRVLKPKCNLMKRDRYFVNGFEYKHFIYSVLAVISIGLIIRNYFLSGDTKQNMGIAMAILSDILYPFTFYPVLNVKKYSEKEQDFYEGLAAFTGYCSLAVGFVLESQLLAGFQFVYSFVVALTGGFLIVLRDLKNPNKKSNIPFLIGIFLFGTITLILSIYGLIIKKW